MPRNHCQQVFLDVGLTHSTVNDLLQKYYANTNLTCNQLWMCYKLHISEPTAMHNENKNMKEWLHQSGFCDTVITHWEKNYCFIERNDWNMLGKFLDFWFCMHMWKTTKKGIQFITFIKCFLFTTKNQKWIAQHHYNSFSSNVYLVNIKNVPNYRAMQYKLHRYLQNQLFFRENANDQYELWYYGTTPIIASMIVSEGISPIHCDHRNDFINTEQGGLHLCNDWATAKKDSRLTTNSKCCAIVGYVVPKKDAQRFLYLDYPETWKQVVPSATQTYFATGCNTLKGFRYDIKTNDMEYWPENIKKQRHSLGPEQIGLRSRESIGQFNQYQKILFLQI